MKRWMLLCLLACACGGSNGDNGGPPDSGPGAGSGTFTGTVNGHSLTVPMFMKRDRLLPTASLSATTSSWNSWATPCWAFW